MIYDIYMYVIWNILCMQYGNGIEIRCKMKYDISVERLKILDMFSRFSRSFYVDTIGVE